MLLENTKVDDKLTADLVEYGIARFVGFEEVRVDEPIVLLAAANQIDGVTTR